MVKTKLLNEVLNEYKNYDKELKPVIFNKNIIPDLFEKFAYYSMIEDSFCCHGLNSPCWVEVIEEGNWDLTLKDVKMNIENVIRKIKKYLYNKSKYEERLFIYQNDQECIIYIYLRDLLKIDYTIRFCLEEDI